MPIEGRPFRAEYEEVHSRPATGEVLRHRGMIYRDSAGRVRQEHFLEHAADKAEPAPKVVSIADSTELVVHFSDSRTKETAKLDLGRALRNEGATRADAMCPVPTDSQSQCEPTRELLGPRIIAGFVCHGIRRTMGLETSEHWLSEDLAMLLFEEVRSPDCQITYRVFNIVLGEPQPGLFVAPET
jgi:hypothetical protein